MAGDRKTGMIDKIVDFVVDLTGNVHATKNSSFRNDLGMDDLDIDELVMCLEEEYCVEVDIEAITSLDTAVTLCDYLLDECRA